MSKYVAAAVLVALVGVSLAPAWWVKGHGSIAEAVERAQVAQVQVTRPLVFRDRSASVDLIRA